MSDYMSAGSFVLNALRHQWNPHDEIGIDHVIVAISPQPCAINGILTRPIGLKLGREIVLNALRHQWNPHHIAEVAETHKIACSTPCGINGILTFNDLQATIDAIRAQHLAASMKSSLKLS